MKRLFFLCVICSLGACRKSAVSGPDTAKSIVLPASGADVMAAENQFTFDVFQAVNVQDTALKNKMVSPFSIYMALGMTDNGAAGATRDSIDGALRLGSLGIDDLNATAKALIQQFPGEDPMVTMNTANSIWYDNSLTPLAAFRQTVQTDYSANAQALDFSNTSATINTINNWVAGQTRQMIPKILTSLEGEEMFLVNAIYFNGAWTNGFDASKTNDMSFTTGNGVTESVPTMSFGVGVRLLSLQNDSVKMVELPYGGGHFVMDILEPAGTDIRTFTRSLTPALLAGWTARMDTISTDVAMPRFKFSYGVDNMQPALTQMGMGIAFGGGADFSDLAPGAPSISRVVHKTAIEVNESGSKAAAATAVGMTYASVGAPPVLHLDHAFLFTIRETTSGAVLFVGILNDPLDPGH